MKKALESKLGALEMNPWVDLCIVFAFVALACTPLFIKTLNKENDDD